MNALVRTPSTSSQFVRALVNFATTGEIDEADRDILAVATGIGEGVGSSGGYLVGGTLAAEIWSKVYSTGQIISRCADMPVTRGNGVLIPAISEANRANGSRFGGVQSYFVDEGQSPSSSKPKLDLLNLALRKLLTVIYATDELVQDTNSLTAFLENVMALEMAFTIEDRIVNGTGVGALEGVLVSPSLITVAAEGAQATGSVLFANLTKMSARLWGPSHPNAVWLMSNDVYQLVLGLTTPGGSEVVVNSQDGIKRILGAPIILCEYTPALGSTGDIMLCDFSQYLLSLNKSPIESSIHVQYVTDETAFKLRYRVDGASAWKSPVTPKNSAVTQSPFIALAARP